MPGGIEPGPRRAKDRALRGLAGPSKDPEQRESCMAKSGRVWIALTILATLLVPVVSHAGQRDRLEEIREQRAKLHERIEVHEAEADSIQAKAKALNEEMVILRRELTKLDSDIAEIESEVRTAQARIDETQGQIDKVEAVATRQAVALYKAGATETIDALMNAKSLAELDSRLEFLGVAAQENTDALIEYNRLQLEIQDEHAQLFAHKQDLEATRSEQSRIYARIDKSYEEHKAQLAKLEQILGHEHAEEGDLLVAEKRIMGDIMAAQAVEASLARGVSREGFIWPLNGAINSYYGPRWGRMHTGIDIDGTTGQPIVASKEGTVIMASSYSGYGNTVIVDHGGGVATLYAHLSAYDVRNGQSVAQGDVVGRVGCTGSCTGDHLHFEVRVNGSPVDPLDFLP